jgi:hypothetical protein
VRDASLASAGRGCVDSEVQRLDSQRLRRVIDAYRQRVGDHAAKYAFAGRDSGEIVLGYRQEGAGWRLYVHDNGCGLPPDHDSRSGKSFGRLLLTWRLGRTRKLRSHPIVDKITFTSDGGTKVDVVAA